MKGNGEGERNLVQISVINHSRTPVIMSQTPSSSPPVTTRQRGTSSTIKKTQKELENADGINTDVRSREQAIAFLQAKEYLVPGKSADLQTLAHVLLQFGNAAVRAPKVVIDGICYELSVLGRDGTDDRQTREVMRAGDGLQRM